MLGIHVRHKRWWMKRTVEEIVRQWEKMGRRIRGKGRVIKRKGEGDDGREKDDVEVEDEKVS